MTWLTVKECASLLHVTDSAVKKAIASNRYTYRHVNGLGRGGKTLQVELSSLPIEAQARYRGEEKAPEDILHFTGKQREGANEKAWIVMQYHQSGLSPDDFIAKYNAENPPEDAITKSKLFRWQRKYKENEVAGLIDQRGGHNRGEDTIPSDAWELFYAMYMTQQKRTIRLCYDLMKRKYPDVPSVSAFERKIKKVPKLALILYRDGEKAFRDALPSMERSKLDIASNGIWFSDHHKTDVFVRSADGKHAVRLWLTVFYDARSNRVMSFIARNASPNATVIKQCLRLGIEKNGVPNEVYFDNGADYRSKDFSRDYPLSLSNRIGIGMIYATPYHGQAKTVERFFGTFTDRFSKRFDTYTGCNAKIRPECMQVSDKQIIAMAPSIEEYIELLTDYMDEYNQTPSHGIDMNGKCPDQVYYENLKEKRVICDPEALRLLCGNTQERTVHKNGISILNNTYYHDLLLPHEGERVIVTYDPENIEKMAIFDLEYRAICTAEAKIRTPFRDTTEEDYKRAEKEKKAARAVTKRYAPARELSLHEIISRNQLMEKDFAEGSEAITIDQITPQEAQNAQTLKATDRSLNRGRATDEESVSDTLLKFYQTQG